MLCKKFPGAGPSEADRRLRIFAALLLLLLFIAGLSVSTDYSMSWDEPHEIRIFQKNIRAYADAFLGEDSQVVYAYESMGLNSIRTDVERDHGQGAYYPFALYMLKPRFLTGDYNYTSVAVPYHYYTFAVCFTAIIAFYLLVTELFGDRRLALLCAVILFIMPRFFAESHYNNKDMVLFALLMDSCCFAVRAIKRRRLPDALLFALFAALAANTKIIGIFFFGVCGLFYIVYLSLKRLWDRRGLTIMAVTILVFCLLYYAFTPAMWGDPVGFFEYCFDNAMHFSRWDGEILFAGEICRPGDGELPRRYLPQFILMTTPLLISLLAALGLCRGLAALWKRVKDREHPQDFDSLFFLLMVCCCSLVPLLVSIAGKSLVYNGWRHFYFSFAGIALLMAYGLDLLRRKWPRLSLVLLLACILFTGVQNLLNHPYQYVYFNILAGDDISQNYELDYGAVSTREGLYYVAETSQGDISLSCLDEGSAWSVNYGFEYLSPEDRDRLELLDRGDYSADYLLENTTYRAIYGNPAVPDQFRLEEVITAYGEPILNIYKRID